ncbi:MAG: signal peptidase II [Bryobacteraceae bacterium]
MKRNLAIIGVIVLLDQLTKLYIQINFTELDTVPVIPGVFNIVHAENPGAAFSMLADAPVAVRRAVLIGLSGVVMAIVAYLLFRPQKNGETPMTQIGLAMVLGGALGNFWDRAVIGTVTDFLQVFLGSYEYPSFNIADSAIFCGAGLLLFDLWKSRKSNPA